MLIVAVRRAVNTLLQSGGKTQVQTEPCRPGWAHAREGKSSFLDRKVSDSVSETSNGSTKKRRGEEKALKRWADEGWR